MKPCPSNFTKVHPTLYSLQPYTERVIQNHIPNEPEQFFAIQQAHKQYRVTPYLEVQHSRGIGLDDNGVRHGERLAAVQLSGELDEGRRRLGHPDDAHRHVVLRIGSDHSRRDYRVVPRYDAQDRAKAMEIIGRIACTGNWAGDRAWRTIEQFCPQRQ